MTNSSFMLIAYDVDKAKTVANSRYCYIEKSYYQNLQEEDIFKEVELDGQVFEIMDRRTAILHAFGGTILLIILDVKIKVEKLVNNIVSNANRGE